MDSLRRDDIELARATPLEERARQALEAIDDGIRIKWIALRARHPDEPEEQIAERLRRWLLHGD